MKARVLLVECADRPGLVHGVTGVLLSHGANVVGEPGVRRPHGGPVLHED